MDDSPQVIQTSGNGFIDKQKKNMLTYFYVEKIQDIPECVIKDNRIYLF